MFHSLPSCKGPKPDLINFKSCCSEAEKWRHNMIQFNNTSVFPNVLISVVKCVIRDLAELPGLLSTTRTRYKSVNAITKKCIMMQWIPYKPPTKNFCLELTEFPNKWNTGLQRKSRAKYLCAVSPSNQQNDSETILLKVLFKIWITLFKSTGKTFIIKLKTTQWCTLPFSEHKILMKRLRIRVKLFPSAILLSSYPR